MNRQRVRSRERLSLAPYTCTLYNLLFLWRLGHRFHPGKKEPQPAVIVTGGPQLRASAIEACSLTRFRGNLHFNSAAAVPIVMERGPYLRVHANFHFVVNLLMRRWLLERVCFEGWKVFLIVDLLWTRWKKDFQVRFEQDKWAGGVFLFLTFWLVFPRWMQRNYVRVVLFLSVFAK